MVESIQIHILMLRVSLSLLFFGAKKSYNTTVKVKKPINYLIRQVIPEMLIN